MKMISLRIPESLDNFLDEQKKELGVSKNSLILFVLSEYKKKIKPQKKVEIEEEQEEDQEAARREKIVKEYQKQYPEANVYIQGDDIVLDYGTRQDFMPISLKM